MGKKMQQKPLIDFTDKELCDSLHHEVENVHYCAQNYYDEFARRSQEKHTKALNKWTVIIAIATVINSIVAVIILWDKFN